MATMISEAYRAFILAGTSEDEAGQVVEALSPDHLATMQDVLNLQSPMNLLDWLPGALFQGAL